MKYGLQRAVKTTIQYTHFCTFVKFYDGNHSHLRYVSFLRAFAIHRVAYSQTSQGYMSAEYTWAIQLPPRIRKDDNTKKKSDNTGKIIPKYDTYKKMKRMDTHTGRTHSLISCYLLGVSNLTFVPINTPYFFIEKAEASSTYIALPSLVNIFGNAFL